MIKVKNLKGVWLAGLALLLFIAACGPEKEEPFFHKANAQFAKGSPEKALGIYNDYLARFPQGRFRDLALLRKGELLYWVLGQKEEAVETFSQLAESFPLSRPGLRAREMLADIYRDERADYVRAVIEYRWLLTHGQARHKADRCQYQIAHCFFLANEFKQAAEEYTRFIKDYPESRFIERAYDELGSSYVVMGQPEKALEIFQTAAYRFPESSLRPTFEFKTGECYEAMGLLDDALVQFMFVREMYDNRPAVDIRINNVAARLKEKQGPARHKVKKKPRASRRK
ncbi:MAG: tetratricopeptide repeat protein [Deltaproteobacteria bacterium]|nr:tetratricopeptide repeat protein [Deltaproteobacteria bacterium]MBW2141748.1 tetratricopeptide repeat protein [Deltaproteobacteria bacterium]